MDLRPLAFVGLVGAACAFAGAAASGCSTAPDRPRPQGQVSITLLHTADMHSRLFPYNLQLGQVDAGLGLGAADAIVNVGGAARLSHVIGRERARSTRVLHLDGGDCFQGAPVFNFFSGEAEMRAESAIGTDIMVVANHEFDRGAQNLAIQIQKWATFPVLAANYKLDDPSFPGASALGSVVVPFTTFDLDGLRVGVVGMANLSSLTSIFDAPNRLNITPLNTVETAQGYVDLLRPLVDVVVFVSHLGLDVDEFMIANTEGIDVVLGGHNHIVLQPPKRVLDCSANVETDPVTGEERHFILLDDPNATSAGEKVRRYCTPRDVVLAHSGAFAKFVGRLDAIFSNDTRDFPANSYDPKNGFELVSQQYKLFPITEDVPEDPVVASMLEPYAQGLDALANLDLLVGYALDGSKRNSTTGGDSPLGNLIATASWLRVGIQTDFSLTNTTGIRTDVVPGPVTTEEMFNIFPFDNSITKMQLSGTEVQSLFDFVARRSAGRGCVSQAQIAGARVVLDCTAIDPDPLNNPDGEVGRATAIYIGAVLCCDDSTCGGNKCKLPEGKTCALDSFSDSTGPGVCGCASDAECPGKGLGSCDVEAGVCWQPIDQIAEYELATSNYLAGGGSGFRVLQRNTTQLDTKVQQRDALIDYIRAGAPCGANPGSDQGNQLYDCHTDADCQPAGACAAAGQDPADPAACGLVGATYVCACPEATVEGNLCTTDPNTQCGAGKCVLQQCRDDLGALQRKTCADAPTAEFKASCETSIAPCAAGGEQCKFLACMNRGLGNFTDGRIRMVGQ